jgi:hypothetical protein
MGFTRERIARIEPGAIASDAPLVAEGLEKGLPQGDPAVLHRVMGINVQVALATQLEIAHRMLGKSTQHVIQKSHPGLHLGLALAINIEVHADGGLAGLPLDLGAPLGHVAQAVTAGTAGNKVFV